MSASRNSRPTTLHYAIGQCSLGSVLIARTERGVCSILLGDDEASVLAELAERYPGTSLIRKDAELNDSVVQLIEFTERPGQQTLELLLDLRGSVFQQRVWQALREIPAGTTRTYAEVAAGIGSPGSVRAVAQACAANPVALAVPCHRVIRSDGSLAGYRWGMARKRRLLQTEATVSAAR